MNHQNAMKEKHLRFVADIANYKNRTDALEEDLGNYRNKTDTLDDELTLRMSAVEGNIM